MRWQILAQSFALKEGAEISQIRFTVKEILFFFIFVEIHAYAKGSGSVLL